MVTADLGITEEPKGENQSGRVGVHMSVPATLSGKNAAAPLNPAKNISPRRALVTRSCTCEIWTGKAISGRVVGEMLCLPIKAGNPRVCTYPERAVTVFEDAAYDSARHAMR